MGDQIIQIVVTVNTTDDDKDAGLWWELDVIEGPTLKGQLVTGKEGWDNPSTRDLVIQLKDVYPYSDRLKLKLRINQRHGDKNDGWGGNIEAVAHMKGGDIQPVIRNTGLFKLGENDNPTDREFPFNV
jgi:hypothetical protein